MQNLFDDDKEVSAIKLGVNRSYADNYNNWRQGEELQKLKDRYGKNAELAVDDLSDSTDTDEDDDGREWTKGHEQQFLQALNDIKAKRIDGKSYFETVNKSESAAASSSWKVEQPMFLRDYERKVVTERQGLLADDDSDDSEEKDNDPTPIERQRQLKESFKSAVADAFDAEGAEEEVLLKSRKKSKKETRAEEEDYREWLRTSKSTSKEEDKKFKELKTLKSYWTDPKLEDGEQFLRDYLLNEGHKESDRGGVPTYAEVLADGEEEEDEAEVNKMDTFEHKYNFRYEEPDQDFIKQYPRTVGESVRRRDDKRKRERDSYKERKGKEKERIRGDLAEMKSLKRSAIERKLAKLRSITGDDAVPMTVDELDADFDPVEYDKKMQAMFRDYDKGDEEEEKPTFSDLSDGEDEEGVEDGEEGDDDWDNMDVLAIKVDIDQKPSTSKVGRKKKHKLLKTVETEKPIYDPDEKSFEQYVAEYYALECEDVVADVRCKFRYRSVAPNDFGLSVDEILTADDKELNAWASLKKTSQYREERDETHDLKAYKKKAENAEKKRRILSSVYKKRGKEEEEDVKLGLPDDQGEEKSATKRRRKRKRGGEQEEQGTDTTAVDTKPIAPIVKIEPTSSKKTRRRSRPTKQPDRATTSDKSPASTSNGGGITDERLAAFGINPKKFRNKQKYAPKKEDY